MSHAQESNTGDHAMTYYSSYNTAIRHPLQFPDEEIAAQGE
jgi:hypothetical protein